MASRILARRAASVAFNRLVTETAAPASSAVFQSSALLRRPTNAVWIRSQQERYFSDSKAASQEKPKSSEEEPKPTEEEPNSNEEEPKAKEEPKGESIHEDEELLESHEDEPAPAKEKQLEAQVKDLKHQLLSSLAEQENTRRIAQRDVANARDYAIKNFAKSLLEVADNLERALEAVPVKELKKEQNQTLVTLHDGIAMTYVGLTKAFESNGLKKFGQKGELFDPNKHDALYEYSVPEKKPGTVGKVLKYGYKLNDRVLRSAEVGVIKKEEETQG